MINVTKASAGSGKTYKLARTYKDCLFATPDEYAYRHILAVTFTNKATSEMKNRILKALNEESATNPRARRMLISILHDYSAFAVSTIDKFFQQALRAFARELGYFSAYQVELDSDSVVEEAVDRILDSISPEDTELLNWIDPMVMRKLEAGEKIRLEDELKRTCKMLRKCPQPLETLSKDNLARCREKCEAIIRRFTRRVEELAPELLPENGALIKKPGATMLKRRPELMELTGDFYVEYATAYTIKDLTYSLGIAREFYRSFDEVLRDRNIMCLDDSNTLLQRIIDGSDAPFIYEKLGVRYNDFLLDEFQDTSTTQWADFYPLVKESQDSGHFSLVVGDVKQSIYRFRNSDWRLLDRTLPAQFPKARIEVLENNYRSNASIVSFNNGFFKFAASALGLENLYADVEQNVKSRDGQPGSVELCFCDKDQILEEVSESVREVLKNGARYSDIVVLVRTNDQGAGVADRLISEGYPVLTDDSLDVDASVTVRRLLSLLRCLDNKDDSISHYYASSINVDFPEISHSLVDLCEELLRKLLCEYPEDAEGETLHIQSFMDNLQEWSSANGNNLSEFLGFWREHTHNISSPASSDSIRVMTIHKSKGLEFNHVIFPYAHSVRLFRNEVRWCGYEGIKFPVSLSKTLSVNTRFKDELEKEMKLQRVDAINLFYVALTRAVKSLKIISENAPASITSSLDKGKVPDYKDLSQILYAYAAVHGGRYGEPYDFDLLERPEPTEQTVPSEYCSIPLGGRLSIPDDSSDFFGEEGVGTKASARLNGVVLHDILSRVQTSGDLRAAVDSAVFDGWIDAEEGEKDFQLLSAAIASRPEWFDQGTERLNEVSVIDKDGEIYRPDRVVSSPRGTVVVDYKFGAHKKSYLRQVAQYVRLYREMGYENVRGYLWYVQEGTVEEV